MSDLSEYSDFSEEKSQESFSAPKKHKKYYSDSSSEEVPDYSDEEDIIKQSSSDSELSDDLEEIRKNLGKGKQPIRYNKKELKYANKPLGKAEYKAGLYKNPNEYKNVDDKQSKCEICGKKYSRSNYAKHKKTQYHQLCCKVNKKFQQLIFDS